jgi:hypothetical protein
MSDNETASGPATVDWASVWAKLDALGDNSDFPEPPPLELREINLDD